MKNCSRCQSLVDEKAKECPSCGQPLMLIPDEKDDVEPNPLVWDWSYWIGITVPFVGFILYLMYDHHDRPRARRMLQGALINLSIYGAMIIIVLIAVLS